MGFEMRVRAGRTVESISLCPVFYVYMCWISQGPDRKQISHSDWVIRREGNNGLFTKGWAGFLKMKKDNPVL